MCSEAVQENGVINMVHIFWHRIGIAGFVVFGIWFVLWWPGNTVGNIFIMTIFLLIACPVIWLVSRRVGLPRFMVTRGQRAGIWVAMALLLLASPATLYWWTLHITQEVIADMGIEVELVEREVRLIDYLLTPSPRRRVVATYQITEPLDSAEQKLEAWNNRLPFSWHVFWNSGLTTIEGVPIALRMTCNPYIRRDAGGLHYVGVSEHRSLTLILRFADAPHWCGLPSNIVNRLAFPEDSVPDQ